MLLCLSTKETDYGRPPKLDRRQFSSSATVEQGQARWREASVAVKSRLVDQDPNCRSKAACGISALFNLAIDSKLRGCDVVAVRVDDVAPSGYAMDRATVDRRKLGARFASS